MKQATAQDFVNVEDITDDILISKDGYIFGYLYVKGRNIKLLTEQEKKIHYGAITTSLENIKTPWQLISIPRPVNVMGMLDELFKLRKNTANDAKLKLVDGELTAINELALAGVKEPVIILKIWEKASKNAVALLKQRLVNIHSDLLQNKVFAEILTTQEIVFVCKMFTDLTVHTSADDVLERDEIPVITGRAKIKSENSLLDLLTPVSGFNFGVNKVTIGNVVGRIHCVTRYPSELSYDWLTPIMNNTNAITSVLFDPTMKGDLAEALSKSIHTNTIDADDEKNARRVKQLLKQAQDADELLSEIDEKNSLVGFATILVMPFCSDEEKLEEVCRDVTSRFAQKRIKLRVLGNVQKQAYMAMSPYYTNQAVIDDIGRHIMPLHTVTAGSPMTINVYRDSIGYYFGRTEDGGMVSLDLLHRGQDRTNSNMTIVGSPGTGKSTALKHIIQTQYMRGVKILVIDPEREFVDMCKALGGTVINAGGEGKTVINPLAVKIPPSDDDDEEKSVKISPLAAHLRTLDIFWDLYLSDLSPIKKSKLNEILLELYNAQGITWETDISEIKSFPTFSDLYALLIKKAEPELASLLHSAAHGVDSFMFNGQTNVDVNNDFVVFDTSALVNSSDVIKRTQYFNILSLGWEIMSADRTTPVLMVCDEAYLMIDEHVPQSMVYLRNISKRCRKVEGAIVIVVQSVIDLLGDKIRQYAQSLLDNAAYKILFGTDGKNLKETAELYDLTESEQEILLSAQRGSALFMMGSSRFKINFVLPKYKLDLMGKAGGR